MTYIFGRSGEVWLAIIFEGYIIPFADITGQI